MNSLLPLTPEAWRHLHNLAARLGLSATETLERLCGRRDLLDHLAAALAEPIALADIPTRLAPERQRSGQLASVAVEGRVIRTRLPQPDDAFSHAVKRLRYRWTDGAWQRHVSKFAEPIGDRVVELGVHLLNAGFIIELHSDELARRIAASDYRPEQRKWVTSRVKGKFAGWFAITWDRDGKDYYRPASLLSGARCYPGSALAPLHAFEEVIDFAETHGFSISDGALDLVVQARRERDAMLLVSPVIRSPEPAPAPAPPAAVSEDILDELADEPF